MNIYYCECLGPHKSECLLYKRLKIKKRLIEKYSEDVKGHIVPEWIEKEVDRELKSLFKNETQNHTS